MLFTAKMKHFPKTSFLTLLGNQAVPPFFFVLTSASVADFPSYSAVQPVEMKFPSSLKLADARFRNGQMKEERRPWPFLAAI